MLSRIVYIESKPHVQAVMKIYTFILILAFLSKSGNCQPVYSIPGASVQPKFVFPIYLEDGNGARDTLYIGYDPLASSTSFHPQDSIYGVKKELIDTSNFYARWDDFSVCGIPCPMGYKVNVTSLSVANQFPEKAIFVSDNGIMPLKVSWDKSLFYSDSLPFPSQFPGPRGQGRLNYGFPYGLLRENYQFIPGVHGEILICDSNCSAQDSIVVYSSQGTPDSVNEGFIAIKIQSWTNGWVSISNPAISHEPVEMKYFNGSLEIINNGSEAGIVIYNLHGKELYNRMIYSNTKEAIQWRHQGLFILQIFNSNYKRNYKFNSY